MAEDMKKAFEAYTAATSSRIQQQGAMPKPQGQLWLLRNKAVELQAVVDELEERPEFHKLVEETHSSFIGDYHGKSLSAWKGAIKNFFRRSCYYIDVFEGKSKNFAKITVDRGELRVWLYSGSSTGSNRLDFHTGIMLGLAGIS